MRPDHFRVEYVINPYMDASVQPDPVAARTQWDRLVEAIERAGGVVEVLPQRADAPDMVYAMNLGLVVGEAAPCCRTCATPSAAWRREPRSRGSPQQGFATSYVGRDGIGAHLEAGDAFPFGDALVVGFGPRTEQLALKHLATELDVRVRGLRITHPGMYHLDLAFCPLDETKAMVCPAAFDDASQRATARTWCPSRWC